MTDRNGTGTCLFFYWSACTIPISHVCFFIVVPVPFRSVMFVFLLLFLYHFDQSCLFFYCSVCTFQSSHVCFFWSEWYRHYNKKTNMTDRNGTGTTIKKQTWLIGMVQALQFFYCSACTIPISHVCFFIVVPVPFRSVMFVFLL
jgi:hypothetical protein